MKLVVNCSLVLRSHFTDISANVLLWYISKWTYCLFFLTKIFNSIRISPQGLKCKPSKCGGFTFMGLLSRAFQTRTQSFESPCTVKSFLLNNLNCKTFRKCMMSSRRCQISSAIHIYLNIGISDVSSDNA